MGLKRWQVEQLSKELDIEKRKVARALKVIEEYIDYFERIGKDGKALKRAKTDIEKMGLDDAL